MRTPITLAMMFASIVLIMPMWVQATVEIMSALPTTQSETPPVNEIHPWGGSADITPRRFVTKTIKLVRPRTGVITVLIDYNRGVHALEIYNVKAFSATDTVNPIDVDEHYGWTGSVDKGNLYRLNLGNNVATTITCEIIASDIDSYGDIIVHSLANVVIRRPLVISGIDDSLRFSSPLMYTFQNTTITTPRIVTSDALNASTNLLLDNTTLTVTGGENNGASASILLGHWSAHTDMEMVNRSKLLAPKATVFLGWDSTVDFSAIGSTLDVRGISAGVIGTTWKSRTFVLSNSILKMGEDGFKFGNINNNATFKDAQIYAKKSAVIESVNPILVEGVITLAASEGQMLTVNAAFVNKDSRAPATFILGTDDYTGTIKLERTVRPCIARINAPLVITPSRGELLAGRITFPTTLDTIPTTAITLDGYAVAPVIQIENVEGGRQLVLNLFSLARNITLDGTPKAWDDLDIQAEDNVTLTLTADTTLTLRANASINRLIVKSTEGTDYTLTVMGNFELNYSFLGICSGSTVVNMTTRADAPKILFEDGAWMMY